MSHIMILLSTPVKEDEKIRHCVVESQGHRVENTPRRKAGVSIVASKTSLSRSEFFEFLGFIAFFAFIGFMAPSQSP